MFARLRPGPGRTSPWPFQRRKGRLNVVRSRPLLEALEDRCLLSAGGIQPAPTYTNPNNTAYTGGPQPATPSNTTTGSSGTTNPNSPQFQQGQNTQNTVGSPSQVIVALNQQQQQQVNPFTIRNGFLEPGTGFQTPSVGLAYPYLNTYETFSFTSQSLFQSSASNVQALSLYSPGNPTGFRGYILFPQTDIQERTVLPVGPLQEEPGRLIVGGVGTSAGQEGNRQPPHARSTPEAGGDGGGGQQTPQTPPQTPAPQRQQQQQNERINEETPPDTPDTRLNDTPRSPVRPDRDQTESVIRDRGLKYVLQTPVEKPAAEQDAQTSIADAVFQKFSARLNDTAGFQSTTHERNVLVELYFE